MSYPTNPIDSLMDDKGHVSSNDPKLRNTLEYFIPQIKANGILQLETVSLSVADRFRGDYFGLLASLNVGEDLYWITMRVNGITGPDVYDGVATEIMLVDPGYYARLVSIYQTNGKKGKQT